MMKAIVYAKYGSPDVLQFREVEKPNPGDNEVLVKVHAVSVNSSDYEFLRGRPLYTRSWGALRPKYQVLGSDIAGRVEISGGNVKQFQHGDAVFGDIIYRWGGFAEYVCAPAEALILKPAGLAFEQAATLSQAALVALQGLRRGGLRHGIKLLINGIR